MDTPTLPPFIPRSSIRYRAARAPLAAPPPPLALTLVAATYSTAAWVRLSFDRDVNIAGIHVGAMIVSDANSGQTYIGSGAATLIGTQMVQVPLVILTTSTGSGVKLSASGTTGIVAVNDGGTWAGVSQLGLPYP